MNREIHSEKIGYYVLFPWEKHLLNCRAKFSLWKGTIKTSFHNFYVSSELHFVSHLFCLFLTLVFAALRGRRGAFSLFIFIIVRQDSRGVIYLAPFPISPKGLVDPLPPVVYSVLPCGCCHHKECHCYIIYNNNIN